MSLQIKAKTVEKVQTYPRILHASNSYLQQWREDSLWVDEVYTQELWTPIKIL